MAEGREWAFTWGAGTIAATLVIAPAQAVTGQELLRQCEESLNGGANVYHLAGRGSGVMGPDLS